MRSAFFCIVAVCLCVPLALVGQQSNIQNQNAPSGSQNQQLNQIGEQGYNAGFRQGVTDYRDRAPYDFQSHPLYKTGTFGYSPSGGINQRTYVMNFRSGYEKGYDDGFYGRSNDEGAQRQRSFSAESSARMPSAVASRPSANQGAESATTLPAGTAIQLQLNNTLSTRSSNPGDTFTATVTEPVAGPQGSRVLIPKGSTVEGQVASVQRGGAVSGTSRLQLRFEQLRLPNGSSLPLSAELSDVQQQPGVGSAITGTPSTTNEGGVTQSKTRRTVGTAAAGGAVGALIGAIAGGGKGAGIGTLLGAGLGVVLSSSNGALDLPAGTPITVKLSQPLRLSGR
ncbi:MAG: TrbI/VirB10 family protein [Terriglobales bacterium]